jgi:hypothetical protein
VKRASDAIVTATAVDGTLSKRSVGISRSSVLVAAQIVAAQNPIPDR